MPTLFDPLQVGDLHLSNRIVMAPLTRQRSGVHARAAPYALMAKSTSSVRRRGSS